jgi:hypothetical protein
MESSLQRPDLGYSVAAQLDRRQGTARLIRTGAIDNDLSIPRNLTLPLRKLLHRHPNGSWNRVWLRKEVERMPEIQDSDVFSGIDFLVEFVWRNACHSKLMKELPSMKALVGDVPGQAAENQESQKQFACADNVVGYHNDSRGKYKADGLKRSDPQH